MMDRKNLRTRSATSLAFRAMALILFRAPEKQEQGHWGAGSPLLRGGVGRGRCPREVWEPGAEGVEQTREQGEGVWPGAWRGEPLAGHRGTEREGRRPREQGATGPY